MSIFQTIAIVLSFTALGAFINRRFFKLPASIGLMLFALLLSLSAMGLGRLGLFDFTPVHTFIKQIDFSGLLLHGMLSFLLFAGALQVDLNELKKSRVIVAILATAGVVIAAFVTSFCVFWAAEAFGMPLSYIDALLFGALIAPTDPVAVLGILRATEISKAVRVKIASESLLNDGVGVVLFLVVLGIAAHPAAQGISVARIASMLAWEGVGSVALGLALGWLTYLSMHSIDDYKTEVLLTLALAAGGYSLAEYVGVSAPITMVVAGLVLGNHSDSFGLTPKTRLHLDLFWELLDETLNAVLFILIGLEFMVVTITAPYLALGLAAIVAVLLGRFVSVAAPIVLMRFFGRPFEDGTIRLMTWGGLRGGLSMAMVLSLPYTSAKPILLGMTYLVVVFSVLFQGTTFRHLVNFIVLKRKAA